MSFEFEKKVAEFILDELHDYGITWDVVESEGFNNIHGFLVAYDVFDTYNDGRSSAYENFLNMCTEDASNNVDFTDKDFEEYLDLALGYNSYEDFKKIVEKYGWNPIKIPDTKKELYALIETDSNFKEHMSMVIWDSVLYDNPYLQICIFDYDGFVFDYIERNL